MAMVRILGITTLLLFSITACKDAKVITPDPVRTYGASVTVKLGDSSPLQSGFYRVQLLRADGSVDERFSEMRELDYVDGEQTFVIAVDASAFGDANAIQTRLYVEAYVGDVAKSEAVGSRSITLVNGEDSETTLSLISAPAPVDNRTLELEYLTNGTWRENSTQKGRLASITFKSAPPEGFSYHLWRIIREDAQVKDIRHLGVLDADVGAENVFNATDLNIDEPSAFYQIDDLVFAISSESPEDTGYLDKPLGWVLWQSQPLTTELKDFITTGHELVNAFSSDLTVAISHTGFASAGGLSGAQMHGEHVANCLISLDHPFVDSADFNGNGNPETTGGCSNQGLFTLQEDLFEHLADLEELGVDVNLGVDVLTVIGDCSDAVEDVSSLEAHQASGVARVLEAMDAFQAASLLLDDDADDEAGAALQASIESLYGQPYTPDLDPADYGLDCIHDNLERLTTTSFVPYTP